MKELETAIVSAFTTMAASGKIQGIIEVQVAKTVESILSSVLSSYSEFGKELEKTVKAGLNVDMKQLGLVGYNDIVLKIIKAKLDNSIEIFGKEKIEKELEELLQAPPAETKLSELVEQLKSGSYSDGERECTCNIKWGDNDGWCRIYLDENGGKDDHSCSHVLAVTKDGEVYSFSIDGNDPSKKMFCGPFYRFERALFQMYAAKTKLIVDEDDVNLYYPGYED